MNSTTRNYLRKLAHDLNPIVMVGKNGLTASVEEAVNQALTSHELIKVKFIDFKSSKKELTAQLSESVHAELISLIGNIAILFRQNRDPDNRKIKEVFF
ncbi:MAG: YhbY family RNA-binding protein [Candidatus Brocadiales bacterium]|nr:YhbY family RNA-binding protein [Candidatus Brocadiales bacterium]MBL7005784.1 YhbY family RNA-binding protein [Spirochaetia bacterium]